jgi:hypothetical protein
LLASSNPLRCSAVSIRAAVHEALGGFNPALRYVVDWDFWLRAAAAWPLAWLAETTVDLRWHPASETHRFKTGTTDLEETLAVLASTLAWLSAKGLPTRPVASAAHRSLARAYLNRAYTSVRGGDGLLARRCLWRALTISPSVLGRLLTDPRLAAMMSATVIAPRSAGRLLKKG